MEVTLFTAAQMVLRFGFVSRTVLVTHPCFGSCCSACTASRFHLSPLHPLQQVGQGWARWGDTVGTSCQNRPKGYSRPYNIMLSNKNWEEGGQRSAPGGGGHCLCITFSPYRLFLHLLNCLDPHTQEFSLLLFPFCPPSHCREGGNSWVVLSCWPGSTLVNWRISFFFVNYTLSLPEESVHTSCFL